MRIVSVGGGPAALYFAILRKKRHPEDDIVLYERNLPYQTFGWGVVFSDDTLSQFEAADKASHDAIVARFAHWTDIDNFYLGERVRSTGHGFAGMGRKELLNVLQERCEALGVRLEFEREVDDIDALRASADLLIGADGVNSKVRTRYADRFKPSIDWRACRFNWLGSDKRFDAFTFIFEQNEHGIFTVHGYPFDDARSTFIVECDEATFQRAGLETMGTGEMLAYFEKLFSKNLDGHKLLVNKPEWRRFPTVKNEHWHFDNVVLMGDAVRTAHFSIGSGTKLAMEDAIALAGALDAHPDLQQALGAYEAERKESSSRLQRVAADSTLLFEHVKRYYGRQTPLQFAFNLMTRSKRITYENLRLRDPALVAAVTREFAERAGQTDLTRPPMFTPITLRGMTVENRVVVSPMCMYSAHDGVPDDFHLVHYGALALGGAGLIFTEMTNVSAEGRITPGCTGIYDGQQTAAWKRITDFVHARSRAKIALQLGHAGRKASTRVMWEGMDEPLASGNWPIVSASPIAYKPGSQTPRELSRKGMDLVIDDFRTATLRGLEAGFDMIEVHMAHGYLLASFLSPLTNVRTDEYGGELAARAKFPLEVLEAVRALWPADKPLSVRISAIDWEEGGLTEEESVALAIMLKARGVDIVHVSTGQTTPNAKPVFGRMWQTRFSDRIRHEADVPTIAVGNIATGDQINTIIAAGRADLCAVARPHLSDPHFTLHAAAEQSVDVPWPPPYAAGRPPRAPTPK